MSAGPWHPRPESDGMTAILWRMVAIAGVWFGLLALVMVLSAPEAPRIRPVQASVAEPPAGQAEPPRTRALRHGGSGGASTPAP